MKVLNFVALVIYLIVTLLLVCTLVGVFVVNADSSDNWYKLGRRLADNLTPPYNR